MGDLRTRGTVTITGAGGYIGRHVVSAVADLGYEPVAVVRPGKGGTADLDPRARIVEADLLVEGTDISATVAADTVAFIHLAWQDGFVHNAPSHLRYVGRHLDVLTAAAQAGVPRVVALGTMHEIGYWEGPIEEDTPSAPRSLYGIAKDALRRSALLTLTDRVEFAWLRCFYIYGDDRRSNSIFGRLLTAADEGSATFPFTSGRNLFDFIHVDELARQIAAAAITPGEVGIINCATGRPISLAEQVEAFISDHDLDIRLEYGAFPDRPYDSPGVWGDARRIQSIMQSHPPETARSLG